LSSRLAKVSPHSPLTGLGGNVAHAFLDALDGRLTGCPLIAARSRSVRMLAAIPSASLMGVEGHPVSVEVHVSNGLPGFTVVGSPD
jgi:hypothetical protein